ncbi:MAG TPA: glycosyltransferase family 2 protein [Acidimicrobiales bacterium]|nr:glycosyltransferase family 2 protein [Acidimicrobiales bacterium]
MTGARSSAVIVDYDAAAYLSDCVRSLETEGVAELVVVENGDAAAARSALDHDGLTTTPLLATGRNLGYGAGANRGIAAIERGEYVLVCNPDLVVHAGALRPLEAALDDHPEWAIVGPRVITPEGVVYPSARLFPTPLVAAGHALLGVLFPSNSFTRRYRTPDLQDRRTEVDWVSGACFLARRRALDEIGGFDEGYFMFAEDMDLCWRVGEAGWKVGFEPAAAVTHHEGVSRAKHPYRMALSHHRAALRFASRTMSGPSRALLPLAALGLGARLVAVWASLAFDRLVRGAP